MTLILLLIIKKYNKKSLFENFQCKHDWKNNLKKNRLIIIDKEKKIFEKMNYYKKTKNIPFSIKKKSILPFFW